MPLSDEAPALLRALPRQGNVIFSGRKRGAQLSGINLTAVLRRMQFDDITVHGSRSSFRDWRAEAAANTFSREVCEHALAHSLPDRKTLRWRDDLFDRCGLLMQARTCFCASATSTVARWDVCTGHPYAR